MRYTRLGDLLISAGLITQEQLEIALKNQKKTRNRLGKELIEDGIITETQLIEALQMQLGVEAIDLSAADIPPRLAEALPKNIAKKHDLVPVKLVGNTLYIAMSDPLNFVAIEDVKNATRKRVIPMIARAEAIEREIAKLYGNEGAARAIEEMKREISDTSGMQAPETVTSLENDNRSAPTIRLVNSLIERAIAEHASDIHLEPGEEELRVRMRVDGLLKTVVTVPKNLQASVLSRLKIMGNMDITERRVPQDGRSNVRIKNADIDLRMSTIPTIHGEKFVIRILDKSAELLTKEKIGFAGENLAKYNYLLENKTGGVILIAGPTGSGKTSTMYAMIRELNTEQVNLITLEDPVEYNIQGINQVQINEKTGMTFAGGLRSILRQDPDIIAVGEIRDGETAQIAMRAAITGHLVLSTVHTNSAIATIERLLDIGTEPYLIAGALNGVISQRLVRRICPQCREEYTPSAEELRSIGLSEESAAGRHFYHGKGCPACYGTGYHGRIAVFEILLLNERLRSAISAGKRREEIQAIAKESGHFATLAEGCMELILDGTTTIAEARRITNTGDYDYEN